jgi:hypothetical protein
MQPLGTTRAQAHSWGTTSRGEGAIGTAANLLHDGVVSLQALVPGGFGLLTIPLGVLGLLSLWFTFRH